MEILHTRCAGIDVHKKNVKVCLILTDEQGKRTKEIRTYLTMTHQLLELRDWLKEQGCTHIAEDRNRGVLETSIQLVGRRF